ncbi:retrovirus-related pol polyprotein from transposon TNT 1-94 [Tanacetum coccineum]
MDVKTAFLNRPLKEEVHVIQLDGFVDPEFPDRVYKLKKALYGPKQAPRAWYNNLSSFLIENHFTKEKQLLSVDEGKKSLSRTSKFINPPVASSLGTHTNQTKYRTMIGGLMYLTASRPDIAFATFSYSMGLWYPNDSGFELIAYSDADHAGCHDDCKSMSGGLHFLGEKLVSWSFKKHDYTALSTAEAEYVSLSACCAQVIWMRTQLLDYGYKFNRIPMYCDSKSAIAIS